MSSLAISTISPTIRIPDMGNAKKSDKTDDEDKGMPEAGSAVSKVVKQRGFKPHQLVTNGYNYTLGKDEVEQEKYAKAYMQAIG